MSTNKYKLIPSMSSAFCVFVLKGKVCEGLSKISQVMFFRLHWYLEPSDWLSVFRFCRSARLCTAWLFLHILHSTSLINWLQTLFHFHRNSYPNIEKGGPYVSPCTLKPTTWPSIPLFITLARPRPTGLNTFWGKSVICLCNLFQVICNHNLRSI